MSSNQRFVAHVDVLGMSALVATDAEKAWGLLSGLVDARNSAHKVEFTFLDSAQRVAAPDQVGAVTFSDTIVFYSKGDTLTDLRSTIIVTTQLLGDALHRCIPVRAGIALGTFFFNLDESMYAGPALIEAYQLGESAQWIGIATSEEVYLRAKQAQFRSGTSDVVVPTFVPIDGGTRDGYAVNWPAIMRNSIAAELPVSAVQIYEGFAQFFGPFDALPTKVRAKYEHTAWFMNQMGVRRSA